MILYVVLAEIDSVVINRQWMNWNSKTDVSNIACILSGKDRKNVREETAINCAKSEVLLRLG